MSTETKTKNEGCMFVMKGGPRKGSECGRPLHLGGTCWRHDERTMFARNLRNRERVAVGKTSKADKEKYEDELYDEVAKTTGEMKSIGGWGSERHGEFHTARKRWREAITKISASQFAMGPSTYRRISKKAQEYDPGGPYSKCPTEECECTVVDGKYPKVGGRVTSDFGHYFSDEECSDGSDCEHEEGDVHDCERQ